MKRFKDFLNEKTRSMTLILDEKFHEDDWQDVIAFYKDNIAQGVKDWTVDLRALPHINSASIGTLMALNTSARGYQGAFKIIVEENSVVAGQIRFSKLDRIVRMEVDFGDDDAPAEPAKAAKGAKTKAK